MAKTREQVTYEAWMSANPTAEEKDLLIAHVESMIDRAVLQLCEDEAKALGERVQQTFTNAVLATNGETPALGSAVLDDAVMPQTLRASSNGWVTHSEFADPLIWVPNIEDLLMPHLIDDAGYYTVRGGNNSGGIIYATRFDATPLEGAIIYRAHIYQTFDTLSPQLEDELVEKLIDMARLKLTALRRMIQNSVGAQGG